MRGSLRPSAIRADKTSRRASFTLRMRAPGTLLPQYLGRGTDTAYEPHGFWKLREDVALEIVAGALQGTEVAAHQGRRQRRALPEVMVIRLGDRGAKASLQL